MIYFLILCLLKIRNSDQLDLIDEIDQKTKKRRIKRVLIKNIEKMAKNDRHKVLMVTWKDGKDKIINLL